MMSQVRQEYYLLPGHSADAFSKLPIGRLAPVLLHRAKSVPFTALDSFDHSLRRTGRFLIKVGTSLDLIWPDGRVMSQSAQRKGKLIADLQDGPVKRALAGVSPQRSLLPIGSGKLNRCTIAFVNDDQKTRCKAWLHILTSSDGGSAALVTLQGLTAHGKPPAEVRKRIKACGGTSFGAEKLDRHLFPGLTAYCAKPTVAFRADHSAFDAATDIVLHYIPVARLHEAGIVADLDIEFLHVYRVALRKIRSVLGQLHGVYAPSQIADLKARFSSLMLATGRLRDLDVYLSEKQKYYDLLPISLHNGLHATFKRIALARNAARVQVARHFRSQRYQQEISDLAQLFATRTNLKHGSRADNEARSFVSGLVWKRFQKIRKIANTIGPTTDATQIHALRIHCKKLRYMLEIFAQLFSAADIKSVLDPLKTLQDRLGSFNDCAVQQVFLQSFLHAAVNRLDGADIDVAQSIGALTVILHLQQIEERARALDCLSKFNSRRIRKLLEGHFHQPPQAKRTSRSS